MRVSKIELIRTTSIYRQARANGAGCAQAVADVRRHWSFIARLSADVKASKRRSKAAKRGWKTRREGGSAR